jgi:hypothetical protein
LGRIARVKVTLRKQLDFLQPGGDPAFDGHPFQLVFHLDEGAGRDGSVASAVNPGPDTPPVERPELLLPVSRALAGVEILREHRVAFRGIAVRLHHPSDPLVDRGSQSGGENELELAAVLAGFHLRA